jgi:uncharacterized protein
LSEVTGVNPTDRQTQSWLEVKMSARNFEETIATRQRLRSLLGEPRGRAAFKVIRHIDEIFAKFIASSPLLLMATYGADGLLDISPRGDHPGFVRVSDSNTLVVPDRPGNQRYDSFENLLNNPAIALFFLVPGVGETLRVAGSAQIVRDPLLQEEMAVNGKVPAVCLIIQVAEAFMQCTKALVRSNIWDPQSWPDRRNIPTIAQSLKTHAGVTGAIEEIEAHELKMTAEKLY